MTQKEEYLMLLDEFINEQSLWNLFKEWLLSRGYDEEFIEELETIDVTK